MKFEERKYEIEQETFALGCESLLFYAVESSIIILTFVAGGRIIWPFHIISYGNYLLIRK